MNYQVQTILVHCSILGTLFVSINNTVDVSTTVLSITLYLENNYFCFFVFLILILFYHTCLYAGLQAQV